MKNVIITQSVEVEVDLGSVLEEVTFGDVMEVMQPDADEVVQHFGVDDLIPHMDIDDVVQHYELSDILLSISPDINEVCDAIGMAANQVVSELTCDWDANEILDALTEEQRKEITLEVFDKADPQIEIQKATNKNLIDEVARRISSDQLMFDQEQLVFRMLLEKYNALFNAVNN